MGLDLKDLYGIDLKDDVDFPPIWKDDLTAFRMQRPAVPRHSRRRPERSIAICRSGMRPNGRIG